MSATETQRSTPDRLIDRLGGPSAAVALIGLTAVLVWCYWVPMAKVVERWGNEAEYSHGYFVPGFAVLLLFLRKDMLSPLLLRGSAWGLVFLAIGALMRLVSVYYYYETLEPISLLPCLAGVALFVGGWRVLLWAWQSIVYLIFMMPLPGTIADRLSRELQAMATWASTYTLQLMGIQAAADGNVILLSSSELGVAEACSGLRMMIVFFATSTAVAFLVEERKLWEKIVIVLSAVPIAIVSNLIRIVTTAVLQEYSNPELAHKVFHDLGGWLMMPMALGFLVLELKILSMFTTPAPPPASEAMTTEAVT